jgi:hypothetical protein
VGCTRETVAAQWTPAAGAGTIPAVTTTQEWRRR